jgi:hypothetical protein
MMEENIPEPGIQSEIERKFYFVELFLLNGREAEEVILEVW